MRLPYSARALRAVRTEPPLRCACTHVPPHRVLTGPHVSRRPPSPKQRFGWRCAAPQTVCFAAQGGSRRRNAACVWRVPRHPEDSVLDARLALVPRLRSAIVRSITEMRCVGGYRHAHLSHP
jgi:hypothetical protein